MNFNFFNNDDPTKAKQAAKLMGMSVKDLEQTYDILRELCHNVMAHCYMEFDVDITKPETKGKTGRVITRSTEDIAKTVIKLKDEGLLK